MWIIRISVQKQQTHAKCIWICCRLMTVQRQNYFPGWRMVCEYWREIESFSCRICAYHIVCYMCNDPIDSFHHRFATTSRDVACFMHNKEHAFESGPSDRKQDGGAFFSSDGWWGELSQVLWWCAILCIFRVVLMLMAIKCSINTFDRCKFFFRVVYSLNIPFRCLQAKGYCFASEYLQSVTVTTITESGTKMTLGQSALLRN